MTARTLMSAYIHPCIDGIEGPHMFFIGPLIIENHAHKLYACTSRKVIADCLDCHIRCLFDGVTEYPCAQGGKGDGLDFMLLGELERVDVTGSQQHLVVFGP